jgi:hypothetical protein
MEAFSTEKAFFLKKGAFAGTLFSYYLIFTITSLLNLSFQVPLE